MRRIYRLAPQGFLTHFPPGSPAGAKEKPAKKHSEKDAIGGLIRVFLARYFFAALFMDR